MTKKEKQLTEEMIKAIKGGEAMLIRAAELDRIADAQIENTEADINNVKYVQALTIKAMANEMRNFYKEMFN